MADPSPSRTRLRTAALPLALVMVSGLLLSGCEAERTPTGTRVAPDTLHPRLDMMWGSLDEDPDLAFSRIRGLAVDGAGRVLVHDVDRAGIQVLSPGGDFIRTLGGRGQGPGEISSVQAMTHDHGLLAAWDIGNARVTIWNDSLELVGSFPTPRRWPAYDEVSIVVREGGHVWIKLVPDAESHGQGFPRPEYIRAWPEEGDTLWVDAPAPACDRVYDYGYRSGFWQDVRDPWFPSVVSALGPGGELYVGCNRDFRFRRLSPGDTTGFVRPNRGLRVTPDERRFFQASYVPSLGTLPELRPEYSRIIPSTDGKVWAFETSEPQWHTIDPTVAAISGYDSVLTVASHGGRFSVFDREGDFIAVVPLPPDVRYSGFPTTGPVLVRGDTIWAVRRGEFQEEYVARYLVPFSALRD